MEHWLFLYVDHLLTLSTVQLNEINGDNDKITYINDIYFINVKISNYTNSTTTTIALIV